MSDFKKYPKLTKLSDRAVHGLLDGECWVFPKLDGTNASIWMGEDKVLRAGSRNRELSIGNDNAGFLNDYVLGEGRERLTGFFTKYPHVTLYGEWLVPHTLKTYRDNAWRKFYVFDVLDRETDTFLPYSEYKLDVVGAGIKVIPPVASMKHPEASDLKNLLEANTYLVEEGKGLGEGVVVKNYDFVNEFAETTWAKMITPTFKETHTGKKAKPECDLVLEHLFADQNVDRYLVDKVKAKIMLAEGSEYFENKMIPRLLNTVYFDVITEDLWDFCKKHKDPVINFKRLKNSVFANVRKFADI